MMLNRSGTPWVGEEGRIMSRQILVDFHPQYLHRFCGADFGRRYHFDFEFRNRETARIGMELHRRYGEFGSLFPAPEPERRAIGWIGFQPLDFLNAALGGRLEFSAEEAVWTPENPLAHVRSMEDVKQLPEIDWEKHWLYQAFLAQYEQQQSRDPGLPAEGVQGACSLGNGEAKLSIHTPYTTAFRLMGESIFELMMLEEEVAFALFRYLFRQYRNQAELFCRRVGWRVTKIHFGDCAATMLSPALFLQSNAVVVREIMEEGNFSGCTQHSCGPSSHLLEAFQELPRVEELQLGYGTDLRRARELFPESKIVAYYTAAALLNESPETIRWNLRSMCEALQDHFVIFGSSIDARTPEENLRAFFSVAEEVNREDASGTEAPLPGGRTYGE